MNVPEMLKSIGEQIQSNVSGKHVYAEPVSVADRTVIPVARVRYGFGGGGRGHDGNSRMADQGGGGGHVSIAPAGVVEITPTDTLHSHIGWEEDVCSHGVQCRSWLSRRKTSSALAARGNSSCF
jgi:uncharacterized spore protein YtfJ